MYLCICNQISDIDITKAKKKYPHLPQDKLLSQLGLGSDCGSCLNTCPSEEVPQLASRCSKIQKNK